MRADVPATLAAQTRRAERGAPPFRNRDAAARAEARADSAHACAARAEGLTRHLGPCDAAHRAAERVAHPDAFEGTPPGSDASGNAFISPSTFVWSLTARSSSTSNSGRQSSAVLALAVQPKRQPPARRRVGERLQGFPTTSPQEGTAKRQPATRSVRFRNSTTIRAGSLTRCA